MSITGLIISVGAGLGCAVVYGIALVVGEATLDELKEAIFRSRPLAIRRQRNRVLLRGGYVVFVTLVCIPTLIGIVAATGENPRGPSDARYFFALAGFALFIAIIMWLEWWRRSAKP